VLRSNGTMSTSKPSLIQVPPPSEIRERLAAVVAEARSLRKLLKLSQAAYRVQAAGISPRPPVKEEGRGDA
jgi:hypothetical protein